MFDFYELPVDPSHLFQGDILKDIPFITPPNLPTLQRRRDEGSQTCNYRATVRFHNAILVSQTCDIDRVFTEKTRDLVLVAPVHALNILDEDVRGNVRGRKIKYQFFLPANGSFGESYGDFTTITYVDSSFIKIEKRILSLSPYGRHWFGYQLSEYLDRPFM